MANALGKHQFIVDRGMGNPSLTCLIYIQNFNSITVKSSFTEDILVSMVQQQNKGSTNINSLLYIPLGKISSACIAVVVQSLSCVQLLATLCTTACQAPLSCTISWRLLKSMSPELVMLSNHLILCCPLLLLLQSFPASGSFPMNQFFRSGGQSIGASASDLPINIQD